MNEIDFRVNCDRNRIMLILNIQKFLKTTDSNNREYLTFIKVINDKKTLILFMFIVKNVDLILYRMIVDNNLYKNIILIINKVAYINDNFILN